MKDQNFCKPNKWQVPVPFSVKSAEMKVASYLFFPSNKWVFLNFFFSRTIPIWIPTSHLTLSVIIATDVIYLPQNPITKVLFSVKLTQFFPAKFRENVFERFFFLFAGKSLDGHHHNYYEYDVAKIPECAYTNKHYYNLTFCLQDDYYPV